jgi:hypothetical protein
MESPVPADTPELMQSAFTDLHASRLYGFALLVALGERRAAAEAATAALSAALARLGELRHPERAGAWLRREALRHLMRHRLSAAVDRPRLAALESQGVQRPVVWGLAALTLVQRGALVAADVERFESADVELVVGRGRAATLRLLAMARERYVASVVRHLPESVPDAPPHDGPVGRRVTELASSGIGVGWAP